MTDFNRKDNKNSDRTSDIDSRNGIQDLDDENLEEVTGGGFSWNPFGTNFKPNSGNDRINGTIFSDNIDAGAGNDTVSGGWGHDTIHGGSGNDIIDGGYGNDQLFGDSGNDTIDGGSGNDTIDGGSGNDYIKGGYGSDIIDGGSGDDTVFGENGNDTINGGDGNDKLFGGSGNDTINGGSGNDFIDGGYGDDKIAGGSGNDYIKGGDGSDKIDGGSGDDTVFGDAGNDSITGGEGNDKLYSGDGNDTLDGGSGNDILSGGNGTDFLDGGQGNDTLDGGAGNDILYGGQGNDTIYGGSGNDTFIYEFGHDNDSFNGHSGFDTIRLDNISSPNDWTLTLDGKTLSLTDLMNSNGDISLNDSSGFITSPDGSIVNFSHLEAIHVDQIEQKPFEPLPLQVRVPEAEDRVAVVVSGLPHGVALQGLASAPVLGQDGSYFQVVDAEALAQGNIGLVFGEGFMGEINLTVNTFTGDPAHPTLGETTDYTYEIEPRHDSILFAQSGSFGIEQSAAGELVQGDIPVDIIITPLLGDEVAITLTDIPQGVTLTNSAGHVFTPSRDGSIELSPSDLTGLRVDSSTLHGDFELSVTVEGEFQGEAVEAVKSIHIEDTNVDICPNGDTMIRLEGSRSDYTVERVGNAMVITSVNDPENITRVNMVDVDHVRFDNAFVSSEDFTEKVDISGFIHRLADLDAAEQSLLIIVRGLPSGAIVDGAVDLGKGVFGIPLTSVSNGLLNLDFPTLSAETRAEISVSALVMTEGQRQFLHGQGRVYGLVTAQATAEAGAGAEFYIGDDGFRAELSAYAGASAVATAGGSVSLSGFGTLSGSGEAEAHIEVEGNLQIEKRSHGISMEAYLGAEAGASSTGSVEFEADFLPATGAGAEGTVGVRAYANAGGQGDADWGDGKYGAGGEGGAEAGVMAEAEGTVSESFGGIGGSATSGVGAGLAVGASGGGHAEFENGVVSFGLSGDVAALVGVEFDFDVTIDFNAVAESAGLIRDGVVSVTDALKDGVITGANAVKEGFIDLEDAMEEGFLEVSDAIRAELISSSQAVEAGLITGYDAVSQGLMDAADAIASRYLDVESALKAGFIDAGEAIEKNLIRVIHAIEKGYIEATDAIKEGFIDSRDAVMHGYTTVKEAVSEGLMNIKEALGDNAIEALSHSFRKFGGLPDSGNRALISAADAISEGLITADYAIKNSYMSATDALEKGYITVEQAIKTYGVEAKKLLDEGWEAAGNFCENTGDAVGNIFSGW